MLGSIGPLEIVVVLIIALIVFGPKRLPQLGHSVGKGIREFRETVAGIGEQKEPPEDKPAETVHSAESDAAAPDRHG